MPEGTPGENVISREAFVARLRMQYENWEERFQKLETLGAEDALTVATKVLQSIEQAEKENAHHRAVLVEQCTKKEKIELDMLQERTTFLKRRLDTLITELARII